jgi:transcriptional regulator with XRE-family HTH domain
MEWSQQKLGAETGLHHDYIGRLERGLENVSADNLAKIANAFGTEPANLLIANYFLDGKSL